MATRYTDEFRHDATRITTAIELTRLKGALDLAAGLSTRNMWVQKNQHNNPMSGPHRDEEPHLS